MNWDIIELSKLYRYLDQTNTKGFIILKNGRIVVEKYFNEHDATKTNPWFSAVKSLTAMAIGVAQDENLLKINHKTSDYLGENWSSLTSNKESLITIKNHLTMTTGLVNTPNDLAKWVCTAPNCMRYNTDANKKWQYHQGAFTKLQRILSQATGVDFKQYIKEKILDKIGASGNWNSLSDANVFYSNTRTMARFGLLSLNNGKWSNQIIVSEPYFTEMTTTSQNLNEAYGYLWWLNGKNSFISVDSKVNKGKLIPNAPNDLIAALGFNDQKIYVIPSKKLVIIRCGNATDIPNLTNSSFDDELWKRLNTIIN